MPEPVPSKVEAASTTCRCRPSPVGAPAQFEDAASGAANATLAAWLKHNHALPGRDGRYTVSQGREVGFDARLALRVDGDGEVWSGGHVCNVVRGTIDWPV